MNVVGGIFIARLLGPNQRGLITGVVAWSNTIYAISSLGVGNAIIYTVSGDGGKTRSLFRMFSLSSVIGGVVVGGAAFSILPHILFKDANVSAWVALFLLVTPVATMTEASLALLQALQKFGLYNIIRLLNPVLYIIVLVFGVLTHHFSFRFVILSQIFAGLISSVLAIVICGTWKIVPFGRGEISGFLKGPLVYGLKTHLTTVIATIDAQAAPLLMSVLVAPKSLGLYAIAQSATSVLSILGTSFMSVIFPVLSKKRGDMPSEELIKWINKSLVIFLCTTAVYIMILPWLLVWVYGEQYHASVSPACTLAIAVLCQSFSQILTGVLYSLDRSLSSAKGRVASVGISVILVLVLSAYGLEGIAVAMVLSSFVFLLILGVDLSKYLKVPLTKIIVPRLSTCIELVRDVKAIKERGVKFYV